MNILNSQILRVCFLEVSICGPGSKLGTAHGHPCCFRGHSLKEIEKKVFSHEVPRGLLTCSRIDSTPGSSAMRGPTMRWRWQQFAVISHSLPCSAPAHRWATWYVARITTSASSRSFIMSLISGTFSGCNIALHLLFWEVSSRGFLYPLHKGPHPMVQGINMGLLPFIKYLLLLYILRLGGKSPNGPTVPLDTPWNKLEPKLYHLNSISLHFTGRS